MVIWEGFTATLVDYLKEHKGRLDLKDFKYELDKKFGKESDISIHCQEPHGTGNSFTIMTARSQIR